MKKHLLRISVFLVALLGLLLAGNTALASETNGTLTTGSSATAGSAVNGVVIAPPTASPGAGTYASAQNIGLTADGASNIRYTVDGSDPTCSSGDLYSGPIAVGSSLSINAISCYPGSKSSTVAAYAYVISIPTASNTSNGGGGGGGSASSGGGGGGGGSYSGGGGFASSGGGGSATVTVNAAHGIAGFVALMAEWGKTGVDLAADFNGDGTVDISDFVWLMANWLK